MTDTVFFEGAINNGAPGQNDEAQICSDRLAQVDGWQREGINESCADGLMSSLDGVQVCLCDFVNYRASLR